MTSGWGRCPVEQQDLRGGGEHKGSRQPSGGRPQGVGGLSRNCPQGWVPDCMWGDAGGGYPSGWKDAEDRFSHISIS